jgi:hypothetical protein
MKKNFFLVFFTLTAFINPLTSSATESSSFDSTLAFDGEYNAIHEKFAFESKTFVWKDQKIWDGDCGADNLSVVINSNGEGQVKSVTWTKETHSGDYWWWSFEGLDAQNVRLWKTPEHKGPRMDDGHPSPRYHFDYNFNFDSSKYSKTVSIRPWKRC